MAGDRQSTNSIKLYETPQKFDQACLSLLVTSCECLVCHSVAKPPTKMCLNGHLCCMLCVLDKPTCPDCKERFSCIRLSVVERMLKIVGCTCKHARFGCVEFVESNRRADHERYCGWRRVQCLWCTARPGVNYWAKHVVKKHGAHALTYDTQGEEIIPLGMDVGKSLFYINGVMFCLYIGKGENYGPLYLTLQCFPTSKEDMNTVFEVFIENKGLHFCQSIHPISDAVKRSEVFNSLETCIIVSPYFIKQKDTFSFKIVMPNDCNKSKLAISKFYQYQDSKLSL